MGRPLGPTRPTRQPCPGQSRLDQFVVGPGVSLSDAQWARIEPLLPGRTPKRGGRWCGHREVIDAIAFKIQTGTQWVHLLERIRSKSHSRPWHHVPHDDEPKGPCRVNGQDGSTPAPSTATGQRVQGQSSTACLRMHCPRSAVSSTPATICSSATSARL
ncbi:transposase [Streptomyces phaeochromogenes]|uniref:transposase n=1 Tax=Streptomyces phaeochromogenes TaxID=1923 RepID=UPI0039A229B1